MLFNYELNRRFHAVHRNGPSKLQKNGEKSTITIEYKHKKREKKPFKQEKITILSHFSQLSKHQILSHPSIYSIYLVFNLIPIRATFLCYRILHFLNKNERESFYKRLVEKTLEAQKMSLKRLFSHPQNGQNKMENKYFLLEKRQKFRNNLTDLHNTKTKRRGRV